MIRGPDVYTKQLNIKIIYPESNAMLAASNPALSAHCQCLPRRVMTICRSLRWESGTPAEWAGRNQRNEVPWLSSVGNAQGSTLRGHAFSFLLPPFPARSPPLPPPPSPPPPPPAEGDDWPSRDAPAAYQGLGSLLLPFLLLGLALCVDQRSDRTVIGSRLLVLPKNSSQSLWLHPNGQSFCLSSSLAVVSCGCWLVCFVCLLGWLVGLVD